MSYKNRIWCSHRREISRQLRTNLLLTSNRRLSSPRPIELPQLTPSSTQKSYIRKLHTSSIACSSVPPKSRDRGPTSEESTQTDFGKLNVLGGIPVPASSIDACWSDGFLLGNGQTVRSTGVILVGGEVFKWAPWANESQQQSSRTLLNNVGQWEIGKESLGILDLLWPKPDLLVIGTGPSTQVLSPGTRKLFNNMGIRVEVSDTRNAAAQYNLLATERGVHEVGAIMIPAGWTPKQ